MLRLTRHEIQWLGAIEPGANPPVEQAPWLWYIPGAWKKRAYHVRGLMDTTWSKARKMVDDRREKGDIRDSMIDLKLAEYEKSGWPMSQYSFNNLFGELLEAGADSKSDIGYVNMETPLTINDSHGQHAPDNHFGGYKVSRGSTEGEKGARCGLWFRKNTFILRF
jgi:hypothetical protein